MDIAPFTSHPSNEVLKQLALGLLTDEELASLESHLEGCPLCRRTLSEANGSNSKIESLWQAPPTLDGLSEITDLPETQFFKTPSVPGGGTASDNDEEDYRFLSAAQAPDELGRLGPYRVLRVLGSGGMGVVFEAEDLQLMRRVALKVMKPGATVGVAARKRFLREAQTAASVEHDHIVPVYQVGEDHGVPFIAMPLLRGQTLAEKLASAQDGMRSGLGDVPAEEDGPPGPSSHKRDGLRRPGLLTSCLIVAKRSKLVPYKEV
ncbi:MAG TPA: protein kinase, partial [Pirellulales bacterium]